MKKRIFGIAAVLLILMTGCSGSRNAKDVDVQTVADELINTITFQDQMSELNQDTALDIFGIAPDDVVKAAVYESTGATAEEVAAFESKDETAADRVKEKAEERIETQKAGFQDYVPAEMEKLKDPVLIQQGKYVILCVSDDNETAKKTIDKFFS
jgi:citrate synthase